MQVELDAYQTLAMAIAVLSVGRFIVARVGFLGCHSRGSETD